MKYKYVQILPIYQYIAQDKNMQVNTRNSLNFKERMKNYCSMKNTRNLVVLHGIF
jgi:hypothetical protein